MTNSRMVSALYRDVHKMVQDGESLLHPRDSDATFRKLGRFVMRNRFKIASGAVKVVVAGVLTGGLGAVAVVGGAAGAYVAGRLYRRGQGALARSNIKTAAAMVGGSTVTVAGGHGEHQTGKTIQQVNYLHSVVLDDIAILCKHESLTKIMNAFAELDADAKSLHAMMPTGAKKPLKSCDDAWSLLEHVERVKLREAELADATELLQDFVEYVQLAVSSYEDDPSDMNHFEWRRKRAVALIIQQSPGVTPAEKMNSALDLLNTQANSGRVFHNRIFKKDYTDWIRHHNPEFRGSRQGQVLALSDGSSGVAATGASRLASGAATSVATTGASTGLRVLNNLGERSLLSGITTTSGGVMGSAVSAIGASGMSAGAGVVSDALFASLQRYVDIKKLENIRADIQAKLGADAQVQAASPEKKGTLLDIFSEIDPEAVEALRKAAKDIIRTVADKVAHLIEADQEFNSKNMPATKVADLAEILMRRQKLQDQVAALTPVLFMFHECTVGRAIRLILNSKAMEGTIKESIEDWIDRHPEHPCDNNSAVCYLDAHRGFHHEISGLMIQGKIDDAQVRARWQGRPLHPGPRGAGGLRVLVDSCR